MKRRDFLSQTALAGVAGPLFQGGPLAFARAPRTTSANEKVRFACIGVGGKGDSDTNDAGSHGEIVALCDVDAHTLDEMGEKYPKAKRYYDYRKMLEDLGPAPERPCHPDYQPFKWRGWLDFGTGALGDMACHTINVAAMALGLFDPESVEVIDTSGIVDRETYPVWSIIRTHFGARDGRGPLSLTWYDGGDKLPDNKRSYKEMLYGEKVPQSGLLLVGEKGSFVSQHDYGAEHTLLPREKFKDYEKPKPTLPRSPGHFTEWVEAIKAGDPTRAMSNFDYAGRL